MLIRGKHPNQPASSEITSETAYRQSQSSEARLSRRRLLGAGLAVAATAALGEGLFETLNPSARVRADNRIPNVRPGPYRTSETETPFKDITTYNNFYEFGTGKSDPAKNAWRLKPRPWAVHIEGLVKKPRTIDIDALMRLHPIEERIYRHRCVEGWSMVMPLDGFSLSELIKYAQPLGKAKYIQFITLEDPRQLPGESNHLLQWPYSEGLRMDEAMHPLAMLVFGLYGQYLPNQNGAPMRLHVPWKYGYKSAKTISRIRFVDRQPPTTWNLYAPNEYGFYSNVNPDVDTVPWSQRTERRITGNFFADLHRIPTRLFNGYNEVASLYAGMDLRKFH